MNTYKKITIILFIIVILLGGKLFLVSNELKELKESKNNIETKQDSSSIKNDDKKNSNDKKNEKEVFKTTIRDVSEKVDGLSEKDNKLVKETVIKFLEGYANYLDSEDISFENRMKHRVYDIKDIMTSKLYENVRLAVEEESMYLGDNYVYRYLKGISIYEVKKEEDKVEVGVATNSIYFDFAMQQETMNEENGDFKTDFKFSLIKEDGKWKIEDFQENYK